MEEIAGAADYKGTVALCVHAWGTEHFTLGRHTIRGNVQFSESVC